MGKGIKLKVKGINMFDGAEKYVQQYTKDAMDIIRMDLVRTSSGLAPIDKGILQDAYTEEILNTPESAKFAISYAAFRTGSYTFNYAEWIHDKGIEWGTPYNLGPLSLKKVPAKSRFSSKAFKVGPGFLLGTAQACKKGYREFISEYVNDALEKVRNKNGGR